MDYVLFSNLVSFFKIMSFYHYVTCVLLSTGAVSRCSVYEDCIFSTMCSMYAIVCLHNSTTVSYWNLFMFSTFGKINFLFCFYFFALFSSTERVSPISCLYLAKVCKMWFSRTQRPYAWMCLVECVTFYPSCDSIIRDTWAEIQWSDTLSYGQHPLFLEINVTLIIKLGKGKLSVNWRWKICFWKAKIRGILAFLRR